MKHDYTVGIISGCSNARSATLCNICNYVIKHSTHTSKKHVKFIPLKSRIKSPKHQEKLNSCDAIISTYNIAGILNKDLKLVKVPHNKGMQYSKYDQVHVGLPEISGEYKIWTAPFNYGLYTDDMESLTKSMEEMCGYMYENEDFYIKGAHGARSIQNFRASGLQILLAQSNIDDSISKCINKTCVGSCIQPVIDFESEYRVFVAFGCGSLIYKREYDEDGILINGELSLVDSHDTVELMYPLINQIVMSMEKSKMWPFLSVDIGITDKGAVKMIEYSTETDLLHKEFVGPLWTLITRGMLNLAFELMDEKSGIVLQVDSTKFKDCATESLQRPTILPREDKHTPDKE